MNGQTDRAGITPGAPLAREAEVAATLALEAGAAIRRQRAGGLATRTKAGGELVTAADLEADAIIRQGLADAFPQDAVLSEEAPDPGRRRSAGRVWIVDPVDGTTDLARGGDEHAVSIGLAVRGRAALGVVYNPARDELFVGADGAGLWRDGAPARVTGVTELSAASLTVSGTEWRHGLDRLAGSLPVRPIASAAYKLARVAAGIDDGTFSAWPRREWDVCAGVALVQAGAGRVTLLDGTAIPFNRRSTRLDAGIVAAGPALHRALLTALVAAGLARQV